MSKPCSERDRLKEAHHQATQQACRLSAALESLPFGLEFQSALEKAEAAHLACGNARHAYEEHCEAHGCDSRAASAGREV
jgi:hypothetical protein